MVGEDDLTGILKGDLQIAVAVFQGIADQVAEEAGTGAAAERPPYFLFRERDPGRDVPLLQSRIESGNTVLQQTVQDDRLAGGFVRCRGED